MYKLTNLFIVAIAMSVIFITGCKDASQPEADPANGTKENVQTPETVVPAASADKVVQAVDETPKSEEQKPVVQKVINEPVPVGHGVWMTDYNAAMKKAAAENKDMLIDFTGSDWCGWCIKLDKEVFSQKKFIETASKDYVFVMLDFPKDASLTTPQLQAQNNELKQIYGPQGFPTVFLADAKGRPYAQTGYLAGGPIAYLDHLSGLQGRKKKFDELMAKAKDSPADGAQKAMFVDEAIRILPPEAIVNFYRDEINMIIALDSENKAGLRDRHRINLLLWDASVQLNLGNPDKAIQLVDSAIIKYKVTGEMAQEAYYFKAIVLDAKKDKRATLASLKKAIEAAPDSETAQHIRGIIKDLFPVETPVEIK